MSNKIFQSLPAGSSSFTEIRKEECYYVDKTPYLKTVFSKESSTDKTSSLAGSPVLLFTRPRRFGKTLLMNMFEAFLKIDSHNPGDTTLHNQLFHGTKITEDKAFCEKYMGKFPVICITLKNVFGKNFEDAYSKLAEVVALKALEFSFLKDSPALDDKEKAKFDLLCDEIFLKKTDEAQSYATSAIKSLSSMLYKHFRQPVYILIDEYDVPLAKAQENGYHKEMVTLISSFLDFLKDPQKDPDTLLPVIGKVIMTGCLKVAKNSIFTGVNNLYVNTVTATEKDYTGLIGFTKDETNRFLDDYDLSEYSTLVKDNYDGYRFFDKEMFCPWDVVNFIRNNYKLKIDGELQQIHADNYWTGTTSSSAVYEYLGYLTDKDTQKMQDLIDGKSISFSLNDSMNYDCLSEHNPDDFWSLLLHTGYLTLDWDKTTEELKKNSQANKVVFARIPNLEILKCFTDNIKNRFDNSLKTDNLANRIADAMLSGDSEFVQTQLRIYLKKFVSVRDIASKAPHENYYHGFLNGIFTNCSEEFFTEYHSNAESGDGYADILFTDSVGEKGVVVELKVCREKESRIKKAEEAISQIEEKNYAEPLFEDENITSVQAVGIAFSGKNCAVAVKKLK